MPGQGPVIRQKRINWLLNHQKLWKEVELCFAGLQDAGLFAAPTPFDYWQIADYIEAARAQLKSWRSKRAKVWLKA